MRLLVFTQKVDKNDFVLGFFHTWIVEMAKKAESVTVICLGEGEYDLPNNVKVYSLGKEMGVSKFKYISNFYKYLGSLSGTYDKVFVHMNQEYVLLAGLYWRFKKIPIYLWRNHPKGSLLTILTVSLSTKVFCTSNQSFTARFKKTTIMPAGIDTKLFKPLEGVVRKKYSICMVGRISPIKHIEISLRALKELITSGNQVSLNIVGDIPARDLSYYNSLKEYASGNNLLQNLSFKDPVTSDKLPEVYSSFEICLNLTESGSFDKTIVEAAACGAIPLVSNNSLKTLLPDSCITTNDPKNIAKSIKKLLDPHTQIDLQNDLQIFVKSQSLDSLVDKLFVEMDQV